LSGTVQDNEKAALRSPFSLVLQPDREIEIDFGKHDESIE